MTQQDTKIPTVVAVPNEKCDGCCFAPTEDIREDWVLCKFIKCLDDEREDNTSVIFMIGY